MRYLSFYLVCFTHPKMFDWFGESYINYKPLNTIEANFIMLNDNFLTSLIIKTWVTCALDRDCIAPIGSSLNCTERNCEQLSSCHRYDQDALTISIGYFIGHPIDRLPAHFLRHVHYMFDVKRGQSMNYFT